MASRADLMPPPAPVRIPPAVERQYRPIQSKRGFDKIKSQKFDDLYKAMAMGSGREEGS